MEKIEIVLQHRICRLGLVISFWHFFDKPLSAINVFMIVQILVWTLTPSLKLFCNPHESYDPLPQPRLQEQKNCMSFPYNPTQIRLHTTNKQAIVKKSTRESQNHPVNNRARYRWWWCYEQCVGVYSIFYFLTVLIVIIWRGGPFITVLIISTTTCNHRMLWWTILIELDCTYLMYVWLFIWFCKM